MKILNLEQGSPEWLSWRQTRITATDASVICGINPYVSPKQLWSEKLGLSVAEPPNEHMLRGQRLEPTAREIFIGDTGIYVQPAVVEHDAHWWAGASLDGISSDGKTLLEIKCPGHRNHLFGLEIGVRDYWQVQIQHQFFVTGAEICYFVSYNPDFDKGMRYIRRSVFPDVEFIARMLEAESRFYHINMCSMLEPDEIVKPLYIEVA